MGLANAYLENPRPLSLWSAHLATAHTIPAIGVVARPEEVAARDYTYLLPLLHHLQG